MAAMSRVAAPTRRADFEFKDFAAAMAFVNRVAEVAEEANHHPDILVHGWNKVRLTLTHPLRGRGHRRPTTTWRAGIDGLGAPRGATHGLVALMRRRRPLSK